jgi:tetrahydromethanopterin S-methyltransferase subunit A
MMCLLRTSENVAVGFLQRLGKLLPAGLVGAKDAESHEWPFVAGKYVVVNPIAPVVVASVAGERLNADLEALAPAGLCMVAPLRSVADVEKLLRNVVSNLSVQHVLVAGDDPKYRTFGEALVAIGGAAAKLKLDEAATGAVQSLKNRLDDSDLAAFRKQVELSSHLGVEESDKVLTRIGELAAAAKRPNTGFVAPKTDTDETGIQRVIVAENSSYEWAPDKAGAFDIRIDGQTILVEHRNAKEQRLRVIQGANARDLCLTLIRNGWVSKLDHAAYLGHELMRAQAALEHGEPFVQDSLPAPSGTSG